MKIAIIAAMQEELLDILSFCSNIKEEEHFSKKFFSAQLEGKEVTITLSGIGKVNAAFASAISIMKYAPDALINIGCAGGIGEDVHVCDVVIANKVAQHDIDITKFGHEIGKIPGNPIFFACDNNLNNLLDKYCSQNSHQGLIVSGDQFIDSKDDIQKILKIFPDALACDMEAAAIAQVCWQSSIPFTVVRAISDNANENSGIDFNKFIATAAKNSAHMLKKLISAM